MTTRDEIIALAKASLKKDVIYHRDGIELEWDDLIDFFQAAQRQAYERAAALCTSKQAVAGDGYDDAWEYGIDCGRQECAAEIRALIEGDGK